MPVLAPEQQQAVSVFRSIRFSIVYGGPGTGKTTVIKTLLEGLDLLGIPIVLCAPTGNAAQRLHKVTEHVTHVIDKILFKNPTRKEALRGCILIMDESSMVNIATLRQLIEDLQPCRVALVGDPHQLQCRDGFSTLSTMLAVPSLRSIKLTHNHRQHENSALMRTLVHMQNHGTGRLPPETDERFKIIVCESESAVLDKALEIYHHAEGGAQFVAYTRALCKGLNEKTMKRNRIQIIPGVCVGDRVMCTTNVYKAGTTDDEMLVANGVIGIVKTANSIEYENGFCDRRRKNVQDGKFRTQFEPARALTVHKSQGNEYTMTGILVLGGWFNPALELLYTALSRFKDMLYVIGTQEDINRNFSARFDPTIDLQVVREFAELVDVSDGEEEEEEEPFVFVHEEELGESVEGDELR